MTNQQLDEMFPGVPKKLFRVHDWRRDVITVALYGRIYFENNRRGFGLSMACTAQ
jgi:hypothetical protein